MNKKEQAIVLKAMKLLKNKYFSCNALIKAEGHGNFYANDVSLVNRYGRFFHKDTSDVWDFAAYDEGYNERLTALALFMVAEQDV